VGERLVVGPAREARPAAGVVAARRVAVEDVVENRPASVGGGVIGTVDESVRSPEPVPGTAAVRLAAQELERHPVHVSLDQAADLSEAR
jgi:hypothetical protein